MLSDSSFELKLRRPIEVHGEKDPVSTLIFHECGLGYDHYYLKLRKHIISSILDARHFFEEARANTETDDALKSGGEIKQLHEADDDDYEAEIEGRVQMIEISLGRGDDLERIIKVFNFMVGHSSGDSICTTLAGARVKEGAWARVSIEDKISAVCKYCLFFGIGLDRPPSKDTDPVSESLSEVTAL